MQKTMTLWIAGACLLGAVACNNNDASKANNDNATTPPPASSAAKPTSGTVENQLANAQGNNANKPNDPIMSAANRDKVKQYPDEVKMSPTPAKLVTGQVTFVREDVQGNNVTETADSIPVGVTVNEVARKGDYYLVLYPSPSDSSKQLAGWVYKDSLEAAGWPMINAQTGTMSPVTGNNNAKTAGNNGSNNNTKLSCNSGENHLRTGSDFCAHECKQDSDCKNKPPGGLCDGVAYEVKGNNSLSKDTVRYCVLNSVNADRAPDFMKNDAGH
jgi:hypothetical protein